MANIFSCLDKIRNQKHLGFFFKIQCYAPQKIGINKTVIFCKRNQELILILGIMQSIPRILFNFVCWDQTFDDKMIPLQQQTSRDENKSRFDLSISLLKIGSLFLIWLCLAQGLAESSLNFPRTEDPQPPPGQIVPVLGHSHIFMVSEAPWKLFENVL